MLKYRLLKHRVLKNTEVHSLCPPNLCAQLLASVTRTGSSSPGVNWLRQSGIDLNRSARCFGSGSRCSPGRAAGKSFRQPEKLPDFPDVFRKRFTREFLPHLQFHNVGRFSLCRRRIFSNCVLSRSASVG